MRGWWLTGLGLIVGLSGCGGAGGGGENPLLEVVARCHLEEQPVPCDRALSVEVESVTPRIIVTFAEPMEAATVDAGLDLLLEEVTTGVRIRGTLEGLLATGVVSRVWDQESQLLQIAWVRLLRSLEVGKRYQMSPTLFHGRCVVTQRGQPACAGSLGPFLFVMR